MKLYKLKRDKSSRFIFQILALFFSLLLTAVLLFDDADSSEIIALGCVGVFACLLPYILSLLIKIHTDKGVLYLKMWFYKQEIPLSSIYCLEHNHSWLYAGATVKYTLSKHNLMVKYNKYDEILLGIEEEDAFIEEVRTANPNLQIKGSNG